VCPSLKPEAEGYLYTSSGFGITDKLMPRCAWEAHLDPITVGFGDEEGVKLYLPFGSVIGHNKVLVTIICDDQSNRSSLLRMHGLSVEH